MKRQRTYLREWRKSKGKGWTLEHVAPQVGLSQPQLGRIEVGKSPYNQDLLEALAGLYGCTVVDLIVRPPSKPADETAEAKMRARDAITALRSFVDGEIRDQSA